MELERYRRLRQRDTKEMYDQSLEEKRQVKYMEKMLDEVGFLFTETMIFE